MRSLLLAGLILRAASKSVLTPAEMQKKMGLGINLGNRLDLWEKPNQTVSEQFFDDFQKAGFTNVRIPVCWHEHTANTTPYAIDPDFLDLVEEAVGWSMSRGMVTILNTHHEKWLDLKGWFDRKLPRLEAIWTQIAARFKDYDQNLLFEVFNEPNLMTTDDLNAMNDAIIPIIRKTNPTRIILLMGLKHGNPSWLTSKKSSGFKIPSDKQLMMEIHNYDPFKYAGSSPTQTTWGSDDDYAALDSWVSDMKNWSESNGLPLYYGEFGVTNAQTSASGVDKWYQAHYKVITENGWGASVWSDGGGHKIYDYASGEWDVNVLKDLGKKKSATESIEEIIV